MVKNTGCWTTLLRFSGPKSSTQMLESKHTYILAWSLSAAWTSHSLRAQLQGMGWLSCSSAAAVSMFLVVSVSTACTQTQPTTTGPFLTQWSLTNWSVPGESNFFGAECFATAIDIFEEAKEIRRRKHKNKKEKEQQRKRKKKKCNRRQKEKFW